MYDLNYENISIEPAVVAWGNQKLEKVVVTTATLGGKCFNLNAPGVSNYVWFNSGASTDPAVSGKVGIEVDISLATTKALVAAAIATELNLGTDYNAKAYSVGGVDYVLIQCKKMGVAAVSTDGTAPNQSACTFSTLKVGSSLDIGLTEDLELGLEASQMEVKASQFGATILERLKNGMNVPMIAINMKESVAAKLKEIMTPYFPEFTPSLGATPTAVQGIGNSLDFTNVSSTSAKLVFHPKKLAETNYAEDFAFWQACPMMKKVNFSGESEKMISVEFSILPFKYVSEAVAHGVFGDHTQNFLK